MGSVLWACLFNSDIILKIIITMAVCERAKSIYCILIYFGLNILIGGDELIGYSMQAVIINKDKNDQSLKST